VSTSRLAPDPAGGQVMITRFECPSLLTMLALLLLHARVGRDVRRRAHGFVAVVSHHDWRNRTVLSVSLWRDLDSVYSMGGVGRHITASRLPRRLGISTRCGVFCYSGDWRYVMFGAPATSTSPLAERRPVVAMAPGTAPQDPEPAPSLIT
jgi:hypothetical protein